MRHGSLFSGIGGFDLASEWMGWENVFHCEWNPFGKRVLKHYWPNAESFDDITKTDFTKYYGTIDIISGGFPCQPYSNAGKRLGKEDQRHLWPQMLRAIREIAPRYVVGENVRGITNWNGGMVFDEVCADLENLGYQVSPCIIPASAVNAPHQRERVWFIAYSNNARTDNNMRDKPKWEAIDNERKREPFVEHRANGIYGNATDSESSGSASTTDFNKWPMEESEPFNTGNLRNRTRAVSYGGDASDADGLRLHERERVNEELTSKRGINALDDVNEDAHGWNASDPSSIRSNENNGFGKSGFINEASSRNQWQNFPTESPICGGNDGLPSELDGITFPKWRNESIKGYGNAICPQVVYEIFKSIEAYENL